MGMAGPDIVLFAVGLLLFAGAGYALVTTGGTDALTDGGSPTNAYSVLFPLGKVEVGKESVADYSSATKTFQVNQTRVTKILVAIACTDTLPGGTFSLQARVTGPNGLEGAPKAGSCGSAFEVEVPVAEVPPSTVAQGSTRDAALNSLPVDANETKAVGEWSVTVNGARGGALPGLPAGNPTGMITLTAETWTPELTPVVK